MFAKATLILWLFASPLAPSRAAPHAVSTPRTSVRQLAVQTAGAAAMRTSRARPRHRRIYRAAARAVERRLLLVAPRHRMLARFVDRSTGLVKLNVTAHCQLKRRPHRHSVYLCRVWQQPRQPSSGMRVVCRTKHKRFVVTAYRRHRRR